MKKTILIALAGLGALTASGQGLNDGYFGMFEDGNNPEIDCNTGLRDVMVVQRCMARDFIDTDKGGSRGADLNTYTYRKPNNTNGISDGVWRAYMAQRPKRSNSSAGSSGSASTRRVGTSNYNTSDAHIQWVRNRQEQIRAAREEGARRKRIEDMRRRIADDNRAAAVTAQTNAMLQGQTNARIASDHWHANQGAVVAQQRARQAVVAPGAQFERLKPKSTGSQQASRLRGVNRPRRTMGQPRNTVRQQLPPVQRTRPQMTPERAAMLKKALMVRAELRRQDAARQRLKNYCGFVLDPHAVPTTGQDWYVPINTPRIPDREIKTSDYYDELLPS